MYSESLVLVVAEIYKFFNMLTDLHVASTSAYQPAPPQFEAPDLSQFGVDSSKMNKKLLRHLLPYFGAPE